MRQLPKFHQINAWNETINEHNCEIIRTHNTKTFGKKLKNQLIAEYETRCDITGCYSCNEEAAREKIKQEKKQKELEEKRKQAQKEEEKAQEHWREYFNMTKSQAEQYHKEKEKQIEQEYAKLMKMRGRIDAGDEGKD